MAQIKQEVIFKNVTRPTTAEERAQIEAVELDPKDIDFFVEQFRKGLMKATLSHEAAVQNNMTLSAEVSIRLSRPVLNPDTDRVEELVAREVITETLQAKKHYKN